jgi:dTDP-4-amino-4,6-dideoxygalactose transaminase
MSNERIFLSPPHMGGAEQEYVQQAFASNYIAPLGPMVDGFEREFAELTGFKHCLALSSGTAAMHLAVRHLGIGPGDVVLASTLTFIGSVTPVTFEGATLKFIDADRASWNLDPDLLAEELADSAKRGTLPKAVIPTDLYGQCADLPRICAICEPYGIPVIADSAEAVGARLRAGAPVSSALDANEKERTERRTSNEQQTTAGTSNVERRTSNEQQTTTGTSNVATTHHSPLTTNYSQSAPGPGAPTDTATSYVPHSTFPAMPHAGHGATAAIYSFNGNKIITSSGGGMLATNDDELAVHARKLSTQAREPLAHYEHTEIGYNYRMSNIVAAIGRGQLRVLEDRVARKREICATYQRLLGGLPGIEFMPEAGYNRANRWLTVILVDPSKFGATPEALRLALEAENIESRPVWKPMHLQPVFAGCGVRGGAVSEDLFQRGLCLPSGTAMTEAQLERIVGLVSGLS